MKRLELSRVVGELGWGSSDSGCDDWIGDWRIGLGGNKKQIARGVPLLSSGSYNSILRFPYRGNAKALLLMGRSHHKGT